MYAYHPFNSQTKQIVFIKYYPFILLWSMTLVLPKTNPIFLIVVGILKLSPPIQLFIWYMIKIICGFVHVWKQENNNTQFTGTHRYDIVRKNLAGNK